MDDHRLTFSLLSQRKAYSHTIFKASHNSCVRGAQLQLLTERKPLYLEELRLDLGHDFHDI